MLESNQASSFKSKQRKYRLQVMTPAIVISPPLLPPSPPRHPPLSCSASSCSAWRTRRTRATTTMRLCCTSCIGLPRPASDMAATTPNATYSTRQSPNPSSGPFKVLLALLSRREWYISLRFFSRIMSDGIKYQIDFFFKYCDHSTERKFCPENVALAFNISVNCS